MSEITGKEAFGKLLGAKVRDSSGAYIGYLKKVYLEKKSGKAKSLIIKLLNGNYLVVDPSKAYLSGDEILLAGKVDVPSSGFELELQKLKRAVEELRGIREKILDLDEALIAGGLSKGTYLCFREALEQRRGELLVEIRDLLEKLEAQVVKLEEERDSLLSRVKEAEGGGEADLLRKLREVRENLARMYELIESARYEVALEMELDDFLQYYLAAR